MEVEKILTGETEIRGYRTDIERLMVELPADERRAAEWALNALEGTDKEEVLFHVLWARHRTEQRRRSDRATDRKRRRLVGTRVPPSIAERCKLIASMEDKSLNAWLRDIIAEELEKYEPYKPPKIGRTVQEMWDAEENGCPLL